MNEVIIKRVYEEAEDADGYRILVDRLWPRGISKEKAALSTWFKEIAPSTELRKWFGHDPDKYDEFREKYVKEIEDNPISGEFVSLCAARLRDGNVTLLYSAKNEKYNNAVVLREWLLGQF